MICKTCGKKTSDHVGFKCPEISESAGMPCYGIWISIVESMPNPGRKVLATYKNSRGNSRIIIAEYIPALYLECNCEYHCDCEYDELRDESFFPEGWYEKVDNWDEFSSIRVSSGDVTHWMPLPDTP